jgi:hypothetical protein
MRTLLFLSLLTACSTTDATPAKITPPPTDQALELRVQELERAVDEMGVINESGSESKTQIVSNPELEGQQDNPCVAWRKNWREIRCANGWGTGDLETDRQCAKDLHAYIAEASNNGCVLRTN